MWSGSSAPARPASTVFTVEPLTEFDPATAGVMATIQPTDIESSYETMAKTMAGTGTVAQQVANLATTLHDDYKLNSKTPGGVQQHPDRQLPEASPRSAISSSSSPASCCWPAASVSMPGSPPATRSTSSGDRHDHHRAMPTPGQRCEPPRMGQRRCGPEDSEPRQPPSRRRLSLPETPSAQLPPDPPQVDQANPNETVDAPPTGRAQPVVGGADLGAPWRPVHRAAAVADLSSSQLVVTLEEVAPPQGPEGSGSGASGQHRVDAGDRRIGRRRCHAAIERHQRPTGREPVSRHNRLPARRSADCNDTPTPSRSRPPRSIRNGRPTRSIS